MAEKAFLMRSSSDCNERRISTMRPLNNISTPTPAPAPISGTAFASRKDLEGGSVVVTASTGVVVRVGVVFLEGVVGMGVVAVDVTT